MLALAKPVDPAKISGQEAVVFFKKSGLPIDKLKHIWSIAARTTNDYLTKDEFYIALRLIAYSQNNMKSDEESIMFDLKVGLPNFDDGPSIL
jgi:epidermal growth factor receptor substrate 15